MSFRPRSDTAPASRAAPAASTAGAVDRLSAVLAAGCERWRCGSPLAVAVPTEMKRRRYSTLVVKREHWKLYLRYDLLLKLYDNEDHRYDDDERVNYDFKSAKETEVEEKKDAARKAFESVYPGEYDTFQLTDDEDPDDLKERIEQVFSDEFDGGYPQTYDTDVVIERLVNELVESTPSE